MIGLPYFQDDAPKARRVLDAISALISSLTGAPASVELVPALRSAQRDRVLELGREVFGPRNGVFDRRAIDEVAADPDALLLVLVIAGRVEGFCFGYYETPDDPGVEGTAFFIDTALVSPAWQDKGIGGLVGAALLLLVHLLGDVPRVGVAVWNGGAEEQLVAFYRRFGFVDAVARRGPHRCLAIDLTPERVASWQALLGIPAEAGADARRAV